MSGRWIILIMLTSMYWFLRNSERLGTVAFKYTHVHHLSLFVFLSAFIFESIIECSLLVLSFSFTHKAHVIEGNRKTELAGE